MSLVLEKVYHQAPGSSEDWPAAWWERALIWENALANRQRIDAERAKRDAALRKG
jgi:hypothetical protein